MAGVRATKAMKALFLLYVLLFVSGNAMAWELHITKKEFWAYETGPKITKNEWLSLVKSDLSLTKDPDNSDDDFLFSYDGDTWPVWWNPDLGEIYTKNPPKPVIEKFKSIAKKLEAKVQDDDGKFYTLEP